MGVYEYELMGAPRSKIPWDVPSVRPQTGPIGYIQGIKYCKIPNPPKPAKAYMFESYMAVWPDPTYGTCSYGHFKILFFGHYDMFEKKHISFRCVLDY